MEGCDKGCPQQAWVTASSATAAGSSATSRPIARECSRKDELREYAQKLRLLGTRLREFSLRKKRKWSIRIDHRGRVRSPDTRNIRQIFLTNGTRRRRASRNGTMTSTMILGQSIEST
jgi:hypothetical protein